MNEPTPTARKVEEAAAQVRIGWSDDRARAVERAMFRRKARRTQIRATMAVAAALLLVLFGANVWRKARLHKSPGNEVASQAEITPLVFQDGSKATPLDRQSVVQSVAATATNIDVDLSRGGARFEVTRNPARLFRVRAGGVAVEVLGTEFTVERLADERVRVSVTHGRVRVAWGDQKAELVDGQMSVFPPDPPPAPSASSTAPAVESDAGAMVADATPTATATNAWRTLAREGDFDKAYTALEGAGAGAVRDEPGELLLAADVARMSNHAAAAIPHLKQVVSKHAGDPRAPLAAFTLGRVLLDSLGRPSEAAGAFAQARSLAPGGALAEDALAREVEAWSRGGDATKAHARAEEYVEKYPKGLRIKSVKKYGGLE